MTTRMPYAWSPTLVLRSASTPGSSVVTSTANGAKSSVTRFQIARITARSLGLKLAGSPSRSKASDTMGLPFVKLVFQIVLAVVWPLKSR